MAETHVLVRCDRCQRLTEGGMSQFPFDSIYGGLRLFTVCAGCRSVLSCCLAGKATKAAERPHDRDQRQHEAQLIEAQRDREATA